LHNKRLYRFIERTLSKAPRYRRRLCCLRRPHNDVCRLFRHVDERPMVSLHPLYPHTPFLAVRCLRNKLLLQGKWYNLVLQADDICRRDMLPCGICHLCGIYPRSRFKWAFWMHSIERLTDESDWVLISLERVCLSSCGKPS